MNTIVPHNHIAKGVERETPFQHSLRTADEAMTFLMLGLEVASPLQQLSGKATAVSSSMDVDTDSSPSQATAINDPMFTKAINDSSDSIKNTDYFPDFTKKYDNGLSIVHLAAMSWSTTILAAILDYKISESHAKSTDNDGNTPMHTVFFSHLAEAEVKEEEGIINCLKTFQKIGLDIDAKNDRNETPVFLAAKMKRSKTLQHLLSFGADPCVVTIDGWSPVHVACQSDAPICLQHLFDTGNFEDKINEETSDGYVPFYLAAGSYSTDCLKILLNNGDHLTEKDTKGKTRCTHLLEKIPSASKFLEELFDESVTANAEWTHQADFSITFEFSKLWPKSKDLK